MAGDWIKMRGNLWDDPRVGKLVDLTESCEATIVGALYWLWATADQHTEDGCMPGLTMRQIDRKTGVNGFAAALVEVGWLRDDPQGVVIANFEEHNGTSAKRRCMEAQRKANSRTASALDADIMRTEIGFDPPNCGAREEKRREEKKSPTDLSAAKPPTCPHKAILGLYAKHLPTLPQPKPELWEGQRAKNLASRWKWLLTKTRSNGDRYATNEDEGLAWFDRFFGYVSKSDFLTGRDGRWTNCDLGWLVNAENFAKVVQGNYENRERT